MTTSHRTTLARIVRNQEAGVAPTGVELAYLLEMIERLKGERETYRKKAMNSTVRAELADRRLAASGVAVDARGAVKNDAPPRCVAQLSQVADLQAENRQLRGRVRDLERELRVRTGVAEVARAKERYLALNPSGKRES